MRIVVALGGNALLRRHEPLTSRNQRRNVTEACRHLGPLAARHELVVSHGNGPQVGLLALQNARFEEVPAYPLDVLGAETQGMIGYLVAQELANVVPGHRDITCVLTMIEVDRDDPAFADPTKPIGPVYDRTRADALSGDHGWQFRPDGDGWRRVVASPSPRRIIELSQIRRLVDGGGTVICAGGGGVPVVRGDGGRLTGIEAVIDKDHATRLLAVDLDADLLVMATDVDAACLGWETDGATAIARAHPDELRTRLDEFGAGSMRPKVEAACDFADVTGKQAVIGSLSDIEQMVDGRAGTTVSTAASGLELSQAAHRGG